MNIHISWWASCHSSCLLCTSSAICEACAVTRTGFCCCSCLCSKMSKRGRTRAPQPAEPARRPSQSAQLAAMQRKAADDAAAEQEAARHLFSAAHHGAPAPPPPRYHPNDGDDDDDDDDDEEGASSSSSDDDSSSSSSHSAQPAGAFEAGHDLRDPAIAGAIVAHEAAVAARPPKEKRKRKSHKKAKTSVVCHVQVQQHAQHVGVQVARLL